MTSLSDANATGSASGSKSFTYDENGNLISDGRKGLEMRWNVLNFLDSATAHDGSSLKYSWLSDGTKVASVQDDGNGNIIKRHYVGSFVFVEDPVSGEWAKESVGWDEGRIIFDVPFLADSTAVDPMAGKYGQMSPYSYCGGNPVGLFDDGGLDLVIAGKNNSSVTFKTNLLEKEISVASLGIDWNGNHTLEGDAVLSAGLDIVGIVDPSGAADLANAALQYRNGEYLGAALSAVGLIPYAGDLVKAGRVGKDVNVISSTVDAFKAGKDLTTKSFRSFTARNFRENLVRLTGDNPAGKDAHHLLPKAFAKQLGNKGINVNDPKYGRWVNRQAHNKTAHRYNQDFRKYLSDNPNATEEQIVEYANTLMKQYELY